MVFVLNYFIFLQDIFTLALRKQIGLKFKEEISEVLHLGKRFVWCWNLDTLEKRL